MRTKSVLFLTGLLTACIAVASCHKQRVNPGDLAGLPADSLPVPRQDTVVIDSAKTYSWLALGDSYTIGTSVAAGDRYAVQAVTLIRSAGFHFNDPEIIASNGWTTHNLLDALHDKKIVQPYNLVTILIGVNNQYQGGSEDNYREEFTTLLKQCIQLAGNNPSHVIVISIPDYSVTPFAKGLNRPYISSQIDAFNQINRDISVSYLTRYLNVTDESRKALGDPSLIASDGLHFSGEEYGIWAAQLLPLLEKAISK